MPKVFAIFASHLLNNKRPLVFEDGSQQRDFVSVQDVGPACVLALESVSDCVSNVGSGKSKTILDTAASLSKALGKERILPQITATQRMGHIRHCFADIGLASSVLGYKPRFTLENGLDELTGWLAGQTLSIESRGLDETDIERPAV
jgi:dTDP-L-rhamnose 4-epimerase